MKRRGGEGDIVMRERERVCVCEFLCMYVSYEVLCMYVSYEVLCLCIFGMNLHVTTYQKTLWI